MNINKNLSKKSGKNKISPASMLLIIWGMLFVFCPLLYVFVISFMQRGANFAIEAVFTLQNYKDLFNPIYYDAYFRSLLVGVVTTVATIAIAYPFSYSLAKMSSKWKSTVMFLMMAPFWTSSLLRLFGWKSLLMNDGWISSLLKFITFSESSPKLMFTMGAVIAGMIYALLPIMLLSIYNSTEKVDWEQVEAARDLGAGKFRAFFTVTLPQTFSGMLAGIVLVFVPSMGLYFIADLMGGSKYTLVSNLIQFEMQNGRNWPFAAAMSIAMLAFAALIIYLYSKASGESDFGDLV